MKAVAGKQLHLDMTEDNAASTYVDAMLCRVRSAEASETEPLDETAVCTQGRRIVGDFLPRAQGVVLRQDQCGFIGRDLDDRPSISGNAASCVQRLTQDRSRPMPMRSCWTQSTCC